MRLLATWSMVVLGADLWPLEVRLWPSDVDSVAAQSCCTFRTDHDA